MNMAETRIREEVIRLGVHFFTGSLDKTFRAGDQPGMFKGDMVRHEIEYQAQAAIREALAQDGKCFGPTDVRSAEIGIDDVIAHGVR